MRRAKLVLTAVIAAVLVMATLSTLLVFFALSRADFHKPIAIYADNYFTAANGVRSGSGTKSDPYVIEDWKLHLARTDGCAIRIQDTKAFFVIRNIVIKGSITCGIFVKHAENGTIQNCTFKGLLFGLTLDTCADLSVRGNQFLGCVYGLDSISSVDCSLEMNTFEAGSGEGHIYSAGFHDCARITLLRNRFNTGGIVLEDMFNSRSNSSRSNLTTFVIGSDNVADGAPIRFYIDREGLTLEDFDLGQLFLVNCSDTNIKGVRFAPGTAGLSLAWCSNVTIADCVIPAKYAMWSLYAFESYNFKIHSCNFSDAGLHIVFCSRFEMTHNSISGSLGQPADVYIQSCDNLTFVNNNITRCDTGIFSLEIDNATICGNTISDCGRGLYFSSLSEKAPVTSTHVYHNNFIDDVKNIEVSSSISSWNRVNISWTDGYPSGGNYWSNYSGSDNFRGPNQDQTGSDGIGDAPYRIDATNLDQYPLMNPH